VANHELRLWLPPDDTSGGDGQPETALFKCLDCDGLVTAVPPPVLMPPGPGLLPAPCKTHSEETCTKCGGTFSVYWDERRKIARVSDNRIEGMTTRTTSENARPTPHCPNAADAS
jgi:hypothetical protein